MNIDINWENIYDGLQIAGMGLVGVFTVLIIFYVVTKSMVAIANKYSKDTKPNS